MSPPFLVNALQNFFPASCRGRRKSLEAQKASLWTEREAGVDRKSGSSSVAVSSSLEDKAGVRGLTSEDSKAPLKPP